MASSKLFMVLVIAAIFVPSISAVEYVVGDEKGWTVNFDYQSWAKGKVFFVGDKLVFKYKEGADNVLKVNGTGFRQCEAPEGTQPLTSGNDVIVLATPGRKWYISGVYEHCEVGNQKLFITVLSQWTLLPPSSPPSSLPPSPSEAPTYSAATTGGAGSHYSWNAPVSSPPIPSLAPWSPVSSPPIPSLAPWSRVSSPPLPSLAPWSSYSSSGYSPFWTPSPSPSASPAARASGSRTTYSWFSRWW